MYFDIPVIEIMLSAWKAGCDFVNYVIEKLEQ